MNLHTTNTWSAPASGFAPWHWQSRASARPPWQQDEQYVAMLLPENVNPRWESQDAAFFVEHMAEYAPDVKVEVFNANNDTATQQTAGRAGADQRR